MTAKNTKTVPTLLGPEAVGGEHAGRGFTFQDAVLLRYLPEWLAYDGFDSVVREHFGDFEGLFFTPGKGYAKVFVEVKDRVLTPALFWPEIERFREMAQAGDTYRRFRLVSAGLSPELTPLRNGLRRVREPQTFLAHDPALEAASYEGYAARMAALKRPKADARFLYDHVDLEADYPADAHEASAAFLGRLTERFPEYGELPQRALNQLYERVERLVTASPNTPVDRGQIERAMAQGLASPNLTAPPVELHTAIPGSHTAYGLCFAWEAFFGGTGRAYPEPGAWDREVVGQLLASRTWIRAARSTRRLRLTGDRRLSAAAAVGAVFSAVAGFAIEMEYRGSVWATDALPDGNTPAYVLRGEVPSGRGDRLAVSVALVRQIAPAVDHALPDLGLAGIPALHLYGDGPVVSPAQGNAIVRQAKDLVAEAVRKTGAREVHLFLAVPSHLALFLGHRLNATAPVQCYEWAGGNRYVPTCKLPTA